MRFHTQTAGVSLTWQQPLVNVARTAIEALAAYAASGARRLLLTHRPSELPPPDGVLLAYDGMELDVEPAGNTA